MGESPSYKQRLEKRSVQCISSPYWGPDTSPAPALRMGQREDCRVFSPFFLFLPQQFQASFLLPVQCNCEMSIKQFIPSHPAALSPNAVDIPPASLHPAPAQRSQAPAPSAEPRSSSTSHAHRPSMTPLEMLLSQRWDPGSLPRPVSDLLRLQGFTEADPRATSILFSLIKHLLLC